MIRLFWNFLMIGALSFGGGYGMISLVRETVLSNGWLTESEFLSFIAVSESTPGPLAVNMATIRRFVAGGLLGRAGRDARRRAAVVSAPAAHCRRAAESHEIPRR